MSSEMMPPLFLSVEGYREAIRIFEVFREKDNTSIRNAVDHAVSCLSNMDWPNYDDTYLSLYTLSLYGHGRSITLVSPSVDEAELPYRGTVVFMLDLDLRVEASPYELLDERGVSLFINFKKAVEGLIPFRMIPRTVGFGCIVVEFDVLVPRLPGLEASVAGGAFSENGLIRSFLSGKEWDALTERFNVAEVAVHGLT